MVMIAMRCAAFTLVALLMSCSSSEIVRIDDYHLREVSGQRLATSVLVEAEEKHHLYGAVSAAEREQRKGHYYTIRYKAEPNQGPVKMAFHYRQAKTGAKILKKSQILQNTQGIMQFKITGDDYLKNGRVLAWMLKVEQGGKHIAEKHSYLWE